MSFEPQKFFIGLIDFFAVILPGALLTFLLADDVGPKVLGDRYNVLHGNSRAIAFLVSSYLSGHFIFLAASLLLDNLFFDRIRRATPKGQIRRLAAGRPPPSRFSRLFARISRAHTADDALREAELLRDRHLAPIGAEGSINAFQWAKARLTLAHPEASVEVERLEADSKFFRSLVLVLVAWAVWGAIKVRISVPVVGLTLALFAFIRYVDQRVKATRQAYWFVVVLEGEQASVSSAATPIAPTKVTHAGGVVFRRTDKIVAESEVLLVHASGRKDEWVLPKGHLEHAERPAEAAVREVLEETACWARVIHSLAVINISTNDESAQAEIFLMEYVGEGRSGEANHRAHRWLPLLDAIALATYPETTALLSRLMASGAEGSN
ncbi:MAG: hypothetical protein QOD72_2046 [Acidimicrobiaceae bacterium]|nr:hypothetical protein [Acidimicrobiaceae bacterium]